jgi:putative NADPH-quinone reductase
MHDVPMSARILILQGHPEPTGTHLCHRLAAAYAEGASAAGHTVRGVDVATLDFPLLRSQADWQHGPTPSALRPVQEDLLWASHVLLCFPLWMGDMPALLKAFLEQLLRPSFCGEPPPDGGLPPKRLKGRSARIVVTMGMPAAAYRWVYRAHSVKSLERNVLGMVGISPVDETLVGGVDGLGAAGVARWEARLRRLGGQAA